MGLPEDSQLQCRLAFHPIPEPQWILEIDLRLMDGRIPYWTSGYQSSVFRDSLVAVGTGINGLTEFGTLTTVFKPQRQHRFSIFTEDLTVTFSRTAHDKEFLPDDYSLESSSSDRRRLNAADRESDCAAHRRVLKQVRGH